MIQTIKKAGRLRSTCMPPIVGAEFQVWIASSSGALVSASRIGVPASVFVAARKASFAVPGSVIYDENPSAITGPNND